MSSVAAQNGAACNALIILSDSWEALIRTVNLCSNLFKFNSRNSCRSSNLN